VRRTREGGEERNGLMERGRKRRREEEGSDNCTPTYY